MIVPGYWQSDSRSSRSFAASARAASARDQFQRRHPGLPAIGRLCSICEASAQRCERFSLGSEAISSGTASALKEAAYAASKAGLTRYTEALALEWAPYGVRVNAIAPGQFPDPEQMTPEQFAEREERGASGIPLRRFGRMRDVGLLAVYLASEASSYVTGQTIAIDGGRTIA